MIGYIGAARLAKPRSSTSFMLRVPRSISRLGYPAGPSLSANRNLRSSIHEAAFSTFFLGTRNAGVPSISRVNSHSPFKRQISLASAGTMPATNPLVFNLKPEDILATADKLIADSKAVEDKVAGLSSGKPAFGDVFAPLGAAENAMELEHSNATFWQYVHMDKDIRDASSAADKKLRDYGVESGLRVDVYTQVKAALDEAAKRPDPEEVRLGAKMALDYKRNGLDLSPEAQEKMKEIKKRLSELSITFSRTVNEDKTERLFTKEELEGMPDDFLSGLTTSTRPGPDGKEETVYHVTMKYPDLIPAMKMAKREETRRILDQANSTRCESNIAVLTEAVKLRRQAAKLRGYANHADFQLEVKMAKTTAEVTKFLGELATLLRPLAEQELVKLLSLKKAEKEARGEPFDGKINSWDVNYYNRVLLETEYEVDDEKIKEYFSMEAVTTGSKC